MESAEKERELNRTSLGRKRAGWNQLGKKKSWMEPGGEERDLDGTNWGRKRARWTSWGRRELDRISRGTKRAWWNKLGKKESRMEPVEEERKLVQGKQGKNRTICTS
jgi:hypothetical protein